MPSETLIGAAGKPIHCWEPLPGQFLAKSAYPTVESVLAYYRRTCDPLHPVSGGWLAAVEKRYGGVAHAA